MSYSKSIPDGYIIDYIDNKLRKNTPEEYVRQNIEKRLVIEHGYSKEQINVEMPIKMGSGTKKRIDLAVFLDPNKKKQEDVDIIIECKKEDVASTDKKDGIEQLKSYISVCLNCEWGLWTNGIEKIVLRKTKNTSGKFDFTDFNDIPSKDRSLSEVDRPDRNSLKHATEDNLLFAFRTCHNHIYVNEGMQKQPAFFELLKVIFCKIFDEKDIKEKLDFYATSNEKLFADGRLTVQKRILKIFEQVKIKYPNLFKKSDTIELKPISLAHIVSELQKYNLIDTVVDVKGKAYEEIVGSNLRGDRGEFFTPRNITKMTIKMLDPKKGEKILDPACGTGGFLVIALNVIKDSLLKEYERVYKKAKSAWSVNENLRFIEKINEIAKSDLFGFDINPALVKATKMNMVMNNDGSGNLFQTDSLKHPQLINAELKTQICKVLGKPKDSICKPDDLALFDIVVTNPPFGIKLPIKDQAVLEQFDLGYIWEEDSTKNIIKTNKLYASRSPEVLFIERCWQFLKPGGRMGIVLPDAILGAPGIEYVSIREWIFEKLKVIASIDLHRDTFQPHNGTKTSVLILVKKTKKEIENWNKNSPAVNNKIFFAMIKKVGHDKRGNEIYKKDEEGDYLLQPDIDLKHKEEKSSHRKSGTSQQKIKDDETGIAADTFLKWKKEGSVGF